MRKYILFSALAGVLLVATGAGAEGFTQDLVSGSSGPEVLFLQEYLCQDPRNLFSCELIDGTYGTATQDAVTRFQYRMGMRDPASLGQVDAATRDYLNTLIDDSSPALFNVEVLAAHAAYQAQHDDASLASLEAAMEPRCEAFERLMMHAPERARDVALSKLVRKRTPRAMRNLMEEQVVKLKGTVVEAVEEQFAAPFASVTHRYIRTSKKALYQIPDGDGRFPINAKVSARGIRLESFFLPGAGPDDVRLYSIPPAVQPGPILNLAVILLEFADLHRTETRQAIATELSSIPPYYLTASYGKTTVNMRIVNDWYTTTQTWPSLRCNREGVIQEAMLRADSEFDFSTINTLLVVIPNYASQGQGNFDCGPGGGAGGGSGPGLRSTPDGNQTIGTAIVTDGIVHADFLHPRTEIHEVGHALGLGHADTLRCRNATLIFPFGPGQCTDAAENFDVMGCCGVLDLTTIHKEKLGWLDGALTNVTTAGSYTLGVYERSASAVKALKFPGPLNHSLYVQYRQLEGNDAAAPAAWVNGAFVHIDEPLVFPDGTFGDSWVLSRIPNSNLPDGQLFHLNETFRDPDSSWSMTPIARDANSLTARVEQIPTLSCAPANRSTSVGAPLTFFANGGREPFQWIAPGATPSTWTGPTFPTSFAQAGQYTVTLKVQGTSLSAICRVDVRDGPAPDLRIGGSDGPVTVLRGSTALLEWNTTNATQCKLYFDHEVAGISTPPSGLPSLDVPTGGSYVFGPISQPYVVMLWCANSVTATSDKVVLNTTSSLAAPSPDGNNSECVAFETTEGASQGETALISVRMRNTGTTTWAVDASPHRLIQVDAGADSHWTITTRPLPHPVAPGEEALFTFVTQFRYPCCNGEIHGAFPMTWRMAEDGVPFGQACEGCLKVSDLQCPPPPGPCIGPPYSVFHGRRCAR